MVIQSHTDHKAGGALGAGLTVIDRSTPETYTLLLLSPDMITSCSLVAKKQVGDDQLQTS